MTNNACADAMEGLPPSNSNCLFASLKNASARSRLAFVFVPGTVLDWRYVRVVRTAKPYTVGVIYYRGNRTNSVN
jgi:hypothetical protein